jgi:hypothetical protein
MSTESKLSEYERVLLAANLIPKGITLLKLDPAVGVSSAPFASPKYIELMRQDPVLLRENGVASVTLHVHDADRALCDMQVVASSKQEIEGQHSDCRLTFRLGDSDGTGLSWMRQHTMTGVLPSGHVGWSCLVEPFDEEAGRIVETLNEDRTGRMLAGMASKAFDSCLWLDERIRIISDSSTIRKRVYGDSSRSLESLLPLDHHKLALRTYAKDRKQDSQRLMPALRLRMNLNKHLLTEVDMEVYPIQDKGYVVGIKSLAPRKESKKTEKPKLEMVQPPPNIYKPGPDPVGEAYRNLLRDLQYSLDHCESINGWLVPIRRITSPEVITDYLLMAIPHHMQGDFAEAADKADFQNCAQLLSFTVYGNANILRQSQWKQLTENSDLIHVVFRFFMNLVPKLADQPARQFSLLSIVHDAQKALLVKRLERECYISTVYRFAIVTLSTAASNPEYYSTDISMRWLRSVFVEALKTPMATEASDRKLLVVHWMCLIWAGAMHSINDEHRTQEAVAVLRRLEVEIDIYRRKFPLSIMSNELMAVCLSNLKTTAGRKERKKLEKKIQSLVNFWTA